MNLEARVARWRAAAEALGLAFAPPPGGVGTGVESGALQWEMSDLDWLAACAARTGFAVAMRGDTLAGVTFAAGDGAPPERLADLVGAGIHELSIHRAPARATARTSVFGWSPSEAQPVSGEVGGAGEATIAFGGGAGESDAKSAAEAAMAQAAAAAVIVRGLCDLAPALRPGTRLELPAAGGSATAPTLCRVSHSWEAGVGGLTRFDSAPPQAPGRPRPPAVTLGHVSDVRDPAGLGRVRLTLPAFAGLETNWVAVVVPGAGAGRGLLAPPAEGDLVAYAPAGVELAEGVVLGGLYGREHPPAATDAHPPPILAETAARRRLVLDDAEHVAAIESDGSGALSIRPGVVSLSAEDGDIRIEAPGKTITIAARRINLERWS